MWFCLSAVAEFKKNGRLCKKRSNGPHSWSHLWSLWLSCPVVSNKSDGYNLERCSTCTCWLLFFIHCFPKMPSQNEENPLLCKNFPEGPTCDGLRSMMLQSSGLWDSSSSDSDDISYWGSKLFAKSFRGSGIKPHDMFLYLSTRNELPCPFPSLAILDSYINWKIILKW